MNVEIWRFHLCGLSVHMVYKGRAMRAPCWRYAPHYRRGDHWPPATNKTVSFISISQFRLAKAAYGGCSLDAHCGGCLHSPFAKNKKERAQRSLLGYSKGIQSSSLTRASKVLSPLLETRSAQKCKHILLIIPQHPAD